MSIEEDRTGEADAIWRRKCEPKSLNRSTVHVVFFTSLHHYENLLPYPCFPSIQSLEPPYISRFNTDKTLPACDIMNKSTTQEQQYTPSFLLHISHLTASFGLRVPNGQRCEPVKLEFHAATRPRHIDSRWCIFIYRVCESAHVNSATLLFFQCAPCF